VFFLKKEPSQENKFKTRANITLIVFIIVGNTRIF